MNIINEKLISPKHFRVRMRSDSVWSHWFVGGREISLVPRPSYHGVPVRGPGNNGLRMRLIKTARYA